MTALSHKPSTLEARERYLLVCAAFVDMKNNNRNVDHTIGI